MNKSDIYKIALEVGFKPREQSLECGATVQDLNPYVYKFAEVVANKYNAKLNKEFANLLNRVEMLAEFAELIKSRVKALEASSDYWEKAAIGLTATPSQVNYMREQHSALLSSLGAGSVQ